VCTASATLAHTLRRRTACPVLTLEQATDPVRFRPRGARTRDAVFVGNATGRRRPVVEVIADAGIDLHIWGRGWTGSAARHVRGEYLPDDELPRVYASARVVLNDTWPDMRAAGILPNRVFDALACGACVVSDDVVGAKGRFGGALLTSDDPTVLRSHVLGLLADPSAALELGRAAANTVRREHGFDARARTMLAALEG
jgi:spore maturation protein CgeB